MNTFTLFDLEPRNPYLSLALDEALCLFCAGQENFRAGLRLWAGPPSVVLGRTNVPEENVRPAALSRMIVGRRGRGRAGAEGPDSIFLCRRASGGGTVVHGPGNINFSLFVSLAAYPAVYPVRDSYETFLGLVSRALARTAGVNTIKRGDSDIVLAPTSGGDDRTLQKISGNAQFRKRGVVVHHGTLLIGDTLRPLIRDLLSHPPREPDYRAGRDHGDFLSSLPADFDAEGFFAALQDEISAYFDIKLNPLDTAGEILRRDLFKLARKLASGIYVSEDWILRGKLPRRQP